MNISKKDLEQEESNSSKATINPTYQDQIFNAIKEIAKSKL